MNATDLTQAFARAAGYTGASPAMLNAMEAIRLHGVTEARAAHYERVKLVEKYKAEPGMFFAAIRPNLSTEEAIEDANRIIFRFRNLESWRQESRRVQVLQAKQTRVISRYFRRFGQRVWMERAA